MMRIQTNKQEVEKVRKKRGKRPEGQREKDIKQVKRESLSKAMIRLYQKMLK